MKTKIKKQKTQKLAKKQYVYCTMFLRLRSEVGSGLINEMYVYVFMY